MEKISQNKQTKRRKADATFSGRSMVEMLGVLAIIGILSVGAIAGYSKAMMKYKLNKQTEQISQLFNTMYIYKDQWHFDTWVNLVPYLLKLKEIPDSMSDDGYFVYDIFNNSILLSTNKLSSSNSYDMVHLAVQINQNNDIEICQNILNIIKEHHGQIYVFFTDSNSENASPQLTNLYYGDDFCYDNRKCIYNITLNDIYQICQTCTGKTRCNFDIHWKIS